MTHQRFFSDNAARVHPQVMAAIAAANHVDTAYDGDALSRRIDDAFSDLFETRVSALWVTSGTAANSLALAAYVRLLENLCREAPYNWFNFHDFWDEDAAN